MPLRISENQHVNVSIFLHFQTTSGPKNPLLRHLIIFSFCHLFLSKKYYHFPQLPHCYSCGHDRLEKIKKGDCLFGSHPFITSLLFSTLKPENSRHQLFGLITQSPQCLFQSSNALLNGCQGSGKGKTDKLIRPESQTRHACDKCFIQKIVGHVN